ncbi:molybdopterin-guanine dinucleotide biosynthesis protein B [Acidithiobacillus sulfuriphilus]|uniref:Molybdopterin-guanine dinucleotide biosynthesis protein B n=2 Tax=Acidithiobacillus sulfuriphilus TaxID=1867749 RepID=A0A3M8R5K9_9PROT|nr:molybdopterin-guanine dinucleotide biosynthesis protein B [Acidithiobacillus sulfuriphilus]RNF63759.1 molybdopterin-guanine dinucleotide biosynthesis protein B [Acidithiobacillus sulfuriphilus]
MIALGIVGYSGSGKTTLLCAVLPLLRQKGMRLAAVKSTHHDVEWDQPGKDSYRLREAGAETVLLTGPQRWFMARQAPVAAGLGELLEALDPATDLALVEGWKALPIPKIEVHRPAHGKALLAPGDARILAVASDGPIPGDRRRLDLNAPRSVAEFIWHWYSKEQANGPLRQR